MGVRCNQCGRPAVVELAGHPLCVDHWGAMERIQQQRLASLEREGNQALMDMAYIAGDPALLARALAEREALAQRTTNVNVANSVVGAINTGTVRHLTVKMDHLSQAPSTAEVAAALKELTTALLTSTTLTPEAKNEAAVQITFLVDQASLPAQQRQQPLIRPILQALQVTLSTTADLLAVWNQWGPAIVACFGG